MAAGGAGCQFASGLVDLEIWAEAGAGGGGAEGAGGAGGEAAAGAGGAQGGAAEGGGGGGGGGAPPGEALLLLELPAEQQPLFLAQTSDEVLVGVRVSPVDASELWRIPKDNPAAAAPFVTGEAGLRAMCASPSTLYWATETEVRSVALAGPTFSPLTLATVSAQALSVDASEQLFFGNLAGVFRVGGPQLTSGSGVVLDATDASTVYFGLSEIFGVPKQGGAASMVIQGGGKGAYVKIGQSPQRVFAAFPTGTIYSVPKGQSGGVPVAFGLGAVVDLAVDPASEELFVTHADAMGSRVSRIDADMSVTTVATGAQAWGVIVDDSHVTWADLAARQVWRTPR